MDLMLEPSSERFDPMDDRWLAQEAQLVADLRCSVGGVERRSGAQAGKKGAEIGAIVVALGSAGVFTAVVEVVKAFVGRDRGRAVRLSWHEDGKLASFDMSGPTMDDAVVRRVVAALGDATERGE